MENQNTTLNTNKLMDMYKTSTFQPALEVGKYKAKMKKHEYVANPTNPEKDYIKFTYEITEGSQKGRELTDNRFEKGFGVMVSHLRQQLGREKEAIQPIPFFNELIEKETNFDIWVTKAVVNGRQRTNFNFLEPIKEETPDISVVDDEVE